MNLLDVGQGTALLLRTPGISRCSTTPAPPILGGWDAGEQVVVPALRALGVRHLDLIVISHADADHAGGLAAVRRAFPEARLIASGVPGSEPCRAGERMAIGETRLDWLHPPEHMPDLRNESSCVLRLRHGGVAVLLPGDIGRLIEGRLLRERREELRAEAVLVPHHGSRHSSSPGFVAATGARFALVSAGTDNPFGHPAPEVVARWRAAGARILATGCGMIELRHDPARGWRIRAERVAAPRAWRARCDPALAGG
ncbi:MAG: MBL fold metallo-hydrolase [Xanthomonadales bacterium]|nr:MBL fold metallo-hydrolase [Xanthomonadales bacterium]